MRDVGRNASPKREILHLRNQMIADLIFCNVHQLLNSAPFSVFLILSKRVHRLIINCAARQHTGGLRESDHPKINWYPISDALSSRLIWDTTNPNSPSRRPPAWTASPPTAGGCPQAAVATFFGLPPIRPFARDARAFAALLALPPSSPRRAAIHRFDPKTPSNSAGMYKSASSAGK
jgi:hypothetical protein